jgi:small-conductance mechanosensitive channel
MQSNWLLKASVIARGIVIAIIAMLFVQAALRANPAKAGGSEKAFSWLIEQSYGQALVAAICIGFLAFALFCFVNAAYRIVPKVPGENIETLASRLASKVREAT